MSLIEFYQLRQVILKLHRDLDDVRILGHRHPRFLNHVFRAYSDKQQDAPKVDSTLF